MFEFALKFWFEMHGLVQNFFTKKSYNNFLMTQVGGTSNDIGVMKIAFSKIEKIL